MPLRRVIQPSPVRVGAPCHLALEHEADGLVGVVPMYLKGHSQGEYVFDYSWADAFERAGGRYYPKLQISVPFTPATGRRLLVRKDTGDPELEKYLLSGMMQVSEKMEVSSVHITFANREQWDLMGELGSCNEPRTSITGRMMATGASMIFCQSCRPGSERTSAASAAGPWRRALKLSG